MQKVNTAILFATVSEVPRRTSSMSCSERLRLSRRSGNDRRSLINFRVKIVLPAPTNAIRVINGLSTSVGVDFANLRHAAGFASCCMRYVNSRAVRLAASVWFAAAECPPSMFS